MSDTPIYEGQFNAAMQSIRDMLASVRDTLTQRLEDARDALTERLATVEAVQRQASAFGWGRPLPSKTPIACSRSSPSHRGPPTTAGERAKTA